jgi:hypothetical protein
MLVWFCHRAGAVFAAVAAVLLTACVAAAASVKFSDDPDFAATSSATPSAANVTIPTPSPVLGSVLTDAPPITKPASADDALDVAGGAAETNPRVNITSPVVSTPVVDSSELMSVQVYSHDAVDRTKSQEASSPIASSTTPSPNFIARQESSPLVIATPEPGSLSLLLIASSGLLARRRFRRNDR